MKKFIAFALAIALTGGVQATPPSKGTPTTKTPSDTAASQANTSTQTQTGAGNAATTNANSSLVCPPGVKPENGNSSKCFARPTRNVQR
jgi:hypothetical protein